MKQNNKSQSVEEIIDNAIHFETRTDKFNGLSRAQATQAIESLITEARIDELSHIQLEHGHYMTQTFSNGQAMTIEDRISELQSQKEASGEAGKRGV